MKSKIKIKTIIILFVIIIGSIPLSDLFLNRNKKESGKFSKEENNKNQKETRNEPNLKTANQEITINTPEDKVYLEPMPGYYQGTYSFENDKEGGKPTGWDLHETDVPGPEHTTVYVGDCDGHDNCLTLADYDDDHCCIASKSFEPRENGTVEFWWYNEKKEGGAFDLNQVGVCIANAEVEIFYNKYYFYVWNDGTEHITWVQYEPGKWYHHRIVFDCNKGSRGQFNWYINGYLVAKNANFWVHQDSISFMRFSTGNTQDNYHVYWDAIGCSWDPDYKIGDNKKEGLLLDFECETKLTEMSYLLDGQIKKEIKGDITIPAIEGFHTIQVFGKDASGNSYKSEIRHFSYRFWNLTGSPIIIDDSGTVGHTWAQTEALYDWCSGLGTNKKPYIIENVYIDGLNSDSCIWIRSSNPDHHFIIKNCILFNSGTLQQGNMPNSGILLGTYKEFYVNNGTIINNKIFQNQVGIYIYGHNNQVTKNIIEENNKGITIEEGSLSNKIRENELKDNDIQAIDNSVEGGNKWDSGSIGNYWDEYQRDLGQDFNNDGFGDYPYNISGTAKSKDNFPFYYNPDFLITQDDIKFEKGVELTEIKATITNRGSDYNRKIVVRFYDNDTSGNAIQIGEDQVIESLKKDESKIVSVLNWTAKKYHIAVVIIDLGNKISELDERNNVAMKGAGGHTPVVLNVKSKFGVWNGNSVGTFFKDVCMDNTFYVTIYDLDGAEDVNRTVFMIKGKSYLGKNSEGTNNRWEFTYNMGVLPGGDSHLDITVYDSGGLDYPVLQSETRIITIKTIAYPKWIKEYTGAPSPNKLPDWMNIGLDTLTITFTIGGAGSSKDLPSDLPSIGGDESEPGVEIEFTFIYNLITNKATLSVKGSFKFNTTIGGRDTEFLISISGTGYFNEKLELTKLEIEINLEVTLTIWGGKLEAAKYVTVGIGLDLEFHFVLNFIFKVIDDTLQWAESTLKLYLGLVGWLEFKLDAGVVGASIRGETGGGVEFTFTWSETQGFSWGFEGKLYIEYEVKLRFLCFEWSTGDLWEWKFIDFSPADVNRTIIEKPWNCTKDLSMLMDSRPRVAADHEGNAMMVWTKNRNENNITYTDLCYSLWDGTDWGEAKYITFDNYADFDPALTYDSDGNVIVVWSRVREDINSFTSENPLDIFEAQEIAYSMWDGSKWSAPQLITNDSYANGRAVISARPNGEAVSVWVGDPDHNFTTTNDLDLFYSIWNGTAWSTKVQLTDNQYMDYSLSLANDSVGNVIASWIRDLDGNRSTVLDTQLLYSLWNGNEWSEPTEVIKLNENKESPSLTFDHEGNALITWVGRNENITRLYFASWDKTTKEWSTPEIVHEEGLFIFNPAINVDINNTAVIVWRGFEDDKEEREYYFTHNTTETYFDGEICYATKDLTDPNSIWSEIKYLTSNNKTDWMASAVIIRGHSNDLLLVWDQAGVVSNLVHEIKPDLTLDSSDIIFSNQNPKQGDKITLSATVHNIGDVEAGNVNVTFYNGDPDNGGIFIGSKLIESLDYDESINVICPNQCTIKSGVNDIYVIIDPLDAISEIDEINNLAFNRIECLPDLFISQEDIRFSKPNPKENEQILIHATIHNQGGSSANKVNVSFYSDGNLIGINTTSLGIDKSTIVSIPWIVTAGHNNITVIIDENNEIKEWNENNNNDSIIISILPDLEIVSFNLYDEIRIYGESLDLIAEIKNDGSATASNVLVEFYDGNPYTDGTIIESAIIASIEKGATNSISIKWKNPPIGSHQIFIMIDGYNIIDESNEENNILYGECAIVSYSDIIAPETIIHLSGTPGFDGWYISDVIISLSEYNEFSEVSATAYSFDGKDWIEYTGPFTITTEGVYTIYYNSTDSAGNMEITQIKTIKIDKTSPETILSYVRVSDVGSIVTLSTIDPGSGVDSIAYSLDGITWEPYITPFTLSTGGIVTVYYNATDMAGNRESTKMSLVIVDFLPPVTTIELEGDLGLTDWYISNVNVTLSATDDLMGVDVITYNIDGMTWIEYTCPFTISDEGITTISYRAVDKVGNIEDNKTEIIKIDKHAPDISITPSSQILTDGDPPVIFSWNVNDMSAIVVLEIRLNDLIISNDPIGTYGISNELGMYNLSIYAEDIHGLSNLAFSEIEIIDDDSYVPELSNLVIIHDIHNVNITLEAKDQSGIEKIIILVNGIPIMPIFESQEGNVYSFTLSNQWILKNDIYTLEVQVVDNDNDRPNDSLNTSIIGTFEITLEDMYNYIDWQLEELKDYINVNLCWILRWILIQKLNHAQKHLEKAYFLVENGKITWGLFNDVIAKIILEITEFSAEIFNKIKFINNEDVEYITICARIIRNNIVILMGASVGTEQAFNIALIEVRLLNLNDLIEKEIDWCKSWCIINHISSAAKCLECAIIRLSMDKNVDHELCITQWKLERAKNQVKWLLNQGKISQELAKRLLDQIENIQAEIEIAKNFI